MTHRDPTDGARDAEASELTPAQRTVLALRKARASIEALERGRSEPIAIIGIGCRFPGSDGGPDGYFDAIERGVDAVRRIPEERWPAAALADLDGSVRWAALLDHVDTFDHACFGISPREAAMLDPQQRLLLEVTWEALEHAGVPVGSLDGTRAGVFAGICSTDYKYVVESSGGVDAYALTGN